MGRKSTALGRQCAFCDRKFIRNEHLQRHQRHHTGEKPFECPLCHKSYARSDVLARHVRNHGLEGQADKEDVEEPDSSTLAADPSAQGEDMFADYQHTLPSDDQTRVSPFGNGTGMTAAGLETDLTVPGAGHDNGLMASMQLPAPMHTAQMDQPPMAGTGFDAPMQYDYNLDFPSVYEALNLWLTPSGMADQRMLQFSPSGLTTTSSAVYDATALELSRRVQQAWPRRRASPVVRVIRTIWRCASEHPADNFFSVSSATAASVIPNKDRSKSRWNMDDECRARLISDCETNLLPAESYTGGVTAPGSPHISVPSEEEQVEVGGLSPQVPRLNFPSTEMLDVSIDFYFRRFHPVLPFLHHATFDAKSTPSSLLLPICLIGLSILNPTGAEDFIRQYMGKLIRFCRLNLTYKGLGKGGAHQLLTSLTSSVLVLYLGLSCERLVDEYQAHMLAIQTLFIADRHGMFAAHDGEAITRDMFQTKATPDEQWKAWARIESVKRLVLCLISIDSAYTRMLDLAANIGIDRVEVVLPCDSALFDAPSASVFFHRVEAGAQMLGPQVDLGAATKGGVKPSSPRLDSVGLRAVLDVLALREAAYRHKLLSKAPSDRVSFVPSIIYAQHEHATTIARDLASAGKAIGTLRHQDASNGLSWNHLCMLLCADIDRVQTACGRMGLGPALKAQTDLTEWAQTASARRAMLHSAQIFHVLSQQRVSDVKTLLPELLLSNAALVMAMYVCIGPDSSIGRIAARDLSLKEPLELLQQTDWSHIGYEGFTESVERRGQRQGEGDATWNTGPIPDRSWAFIVDGGAFTFGGETYTPGAISARKVVLTYAHLVDEISPRSGSEHSRLLRTVGDFLGGVGNQSPVPMTENLCAGDTVIS